MFRRFLLTALVAGITVTTTPAASAVTVGSLGVLYQEPRYALLVDDGQAALMRTQVMCQEGHHGFMTGYLSWTTDDGSSGQAEGRTADFACTGSKQVVWVEVRTVDPGEPIPTDGVWLGGVTLHVYCEAGPEVCDSGIYEGDYPLTMRATGR